MSTKNNIDTLKSSSILGSVLLLVIGILLCIGVSGSDILTKIIGVVALLAGIGLMVESYLTTRSFIFGSGIAAAFFIAFGVMCFLTTLPFNLLIALLLIVFGVMLLVDGVVAIAVRKNNTVGLTEIVLAVTALTLGFCLYFIADFQRFASLIFGIYLIVAGVLGLVKVLAKK